MLEGTAESSQGPKSVQYVIVLSPEIRIQMVIAEVQTTSPTRTFSVFCVLVKCIYPDQKQGKKVQSQDAATWISLLQ